MAQINYSVLEMAFDDGLFFGDHIRPYYNSSILTCHKILNFIKKRENSTNNQICERLGLAVNTVRQYTHWLENKKMIYGVFENGEIVWVATPR